MADENNQNNVPQQEMGSQAYTYQNMPPMQPVQPQEEKANVGLAILSFIIPIVGLILYLVKKTESPKTAKACGKCALASVIIGVVLSIIYYVVIAVVMVGTGMF